MLINQIVLFNVFSVTKCRFWGGFSGA